MRKWCKVLSLCIGIIITITGCTKFPTDLSSFLITPSDLNTGQLTEVIAFLKNIEIPKEAPQGIYAKIESVVQKLERADGFISAGKENEAQEVLREAVTQIDEIISQITSLKCSNKCCETKNNCIPDEKAGKLIGQLQAAKQMIERMLCPSFQIAFQDLGVNWEWDIFVINEDGTGLVNLTTHSAKDKYPKWSPDGTRILFISDREGYQTAYVMNADGTNVYRLVPFEVCSIYWGRNGTIVLIKGPAWRWGDIYVVEPDGSNLRRVTSDGGWYAATLSPNGDVICAYRASTVSDGDSLWLISIDGTERRKIGKGWVPGLWSPDGRYVATHNRSQVAIVDTRTLEIRTIVTAAQIGVRKIISRVRWAPTGQALTFTALSYTTSSDIWMVGANGSNPTPIIASAYQERGGGWSPDGMRILFTSNRDGFFGIYVHDLLTGVDRLVYRAVQTYRVYWNYPVWKYGIL